MIFSRSGDRSRKSVAAIADFWKWWSKARDRVEKSIKGGGFDASFVNEMNKRVDSIHSDLQWEFSKGHRSEHCLVVCAPGNAALRATTERWLAMAPAADATWSYFSNRQADPRVATSTLQFGGHEVALERLRFGADVDTDRHEIDVTVFHPIFSVLDEHDRLQVTFLALDWALGESDVELWVGRVEASRTEPQRPHTMAQLRSAVTNLAQKTGEDCFVVLGGRTAAGDPMTGIARRPLKPGRFPRFDTHIGVELPYRDTGNGSGMPDKDSQTALEDFEDQLVSALSPDGALVARETSGNRRTLHFYVDGVTKAADVVKRFLPQWQAGRARFAASYDPAWEAVDHLRP